MAQTYSVDQYLLDRADIEDVVNLMYLHLDHRDFSPIATDVFAQDLKIDYSSLFGNEPYRTTGAKQAETWKEQIKSFPKSQHAVTVVSNLPRPGSTGLPDSTTTVAQFLVAMVHNNKSFINQNRGRLYLDLVRTKDTSGNPWRISGLKVDMVCVTYEEDKTGQSLVPPDD